LRRHWLQHRRRSTFGWWYAQARGHTPTRAAVRDALLFSFFSRSLARGMHRHTATTTLGVRTRLAPRTSGITVLTRLSMPVSVGNRAAHHRRVLYRTCAEPPDPSRPHTRPHTWPLSLRFNPHTHRQREREISTHTYLCTHLNAPPPTRVTVYAGHTVRGAVHSGQCDGRAAAQPRAQVHRSGDVSASDCRYTKWPFLPMPA
jgi:hypothetical protein